MTICPCCKKQISFYSFFFWSLSAGFASGLNFSIFRCSHCQKIIATHLLGSASLGTNFKRVALTFVISPALILGAFSLSLFWGWSLLETLSLGAVLILAFMFAEAYRCYSKLSLHFPPLVFLFVQGQWLYFDLKGLPIGPKLKLCQESVKCVRLEDVKAVRIKGGYFTIDLASRDSLDTYFAEEILSFVLEQLLPYLPDSVPVMLNDQLYQLSTRIKDHRQQIISLPKVEMDPIPLTAAPWGVIQLCGVLLIVVLCLFLGWAAFAAVTP